MAKYRVTLSDDRTIDVYSDTEERAKKQASHQEKTRIAIAGKRDRLEGEPDPAVPVSVVLLKP